VRPIKLKLERVLKVVAFAMVLTSTILAESSAAQATTIKKKDGGTIEGEIQGFLVQADVVPRKKGDKIKSYAALYFKVAGADIGAIDEAGVSLGKGKQARYLLVEQKDKPNDLEVLEVLQGDSLDTANIDAMIGYTDKHHASLESSIYDPAKASGQIVIASNPVRGDLILANDGTGRRTRIASNPYAKGIVITGDFARFKVLGTYRMEAGKVMVVPTIEIVTEKGTLSIAIEEIVEFGPTEWELKKD